MLEKLATLAANKGFVRYFKNTSWMFGEQMLRLVAGLFVGIWVARYLGPEQFGLFSYALAFTAIFGGIAKLGLDGIIVRELVNHPENRDIYLGTAFWLKVTGAVLVLGVITIAVQFTTNDATTNLFIFIIAAGLVFQGFEVVGFYFQSEVLAKFISICKATQLALSSIVKIYLVITERELIWFVLVVLFDQVTLAITFFIVYRSQHMPSFYRMFSPAAAKNLLRDSWPLILSSVVVSIYMRIDQVMIKEMLGVHEVGIYSVAVRLSEVWYFVPVLIATSLFPAILNAKKIGEDLYVKRLQSLYTLMVWMAITIAVPMTLLSNWIVTLLYGEAYREAGQVLMIHVWAGVFVFLGVASGKWFLSENLQILAFWRTFWGMIVNVILNFSLIPGYGVKGAAVATLVSQIVAAYLFDFFNSKTRIMFYVKTRSLFLFTQIPGIKP